MPSPGFGMIRTSRMMCVGFVALSQLSSIVGIPRLVGDSIRPVFKVCSLC